jgi:hypothetical protein
MEPTAMQTFLGLLGSVFTSIFAKFADILNLFTTSNVLILGLALTITGAIIGYAVRLITSPRLVKNAAIFITPFHIKALRI